MSNSSSDSNKLKENLNELEALTSRLTKAIAKKRQTDPALQGPGIDLYAKAAASYYAQMMAHPEKVIENQVQFWRKSLENFSAAQQKINSQNDDSPDQKNTKDRRFKNPLWESNPFFNFAKEQYLLSAQAIDQSIGELDEIDEKDRQRVTFFARQMVDMLSPSNFLGTNPDALEKAIQTDGKSLVDGLANLVRDLEDNEGELQVTLADRQAFEVGVNIATTPGKVVFKNRMFELIQYEPMTEEVHETPLLILPPWINKFYILDLKEKNSFIRHALSEGFTVFIVSWVNPDESYHDVGINTYVNEGALAAIDAVLEISKTQKLNAIGYCIGGTLLTIALALMAQTKDDRVNSATFFTTLTDFTDAGDIGVFIDEEFLCAIEREVDRTGYLDGSFMSRTFSFLRSNDLVYAPAIRSYMLGEAPPAFDLLYWNGDSTNLPAKMAKEYLRHLYQSNELVKGIFQLDDVTLNMADIKTPSYIIATKTDHIAPWKSSFYGLSRLGGKKTFILAESGHIAGIVNPPSSGKYGFWKNDAEFTDAHKWLENVSRQEGSWWEHWSQWLATRSGNLISARSPGSEEYLAISDAPGTYVKGPGSK